LKISSEKRKIGDFDCQRAELDYGGRKWIAWFAAEIPFQDVPYVFHGLPA
jgi:GLPGLI family protein